MEIKKKYKEDTPNIKDILSMDINYNQKCNLLEKMYAFSNADLLSPEYNNNLKQLNTIINQYKDTELYKLENEIIKRSNDTFYSENYKERILKSNMSFENKVVAYKRYEVMNSYETTDTSEYSKYKAWMDILLSIPFDKKYIDNENIDVENISQRLFIKNTRTILDKRLSFLEKPKDQIINIVTQSIRNPKISINAYFHIIQ